MTSADLIAAAMIVTIVTASHGETRVTSHAVPHALMIVIMDAIAAVRVPKIADETTVVDATKATDVTTAGVTAAGVSEAGIAAIAVTPTPWTMTNPGPAQGAEMTNHHDGQTRAPTIPPATERVATTIQFITSTACMKFTPSTLTTHPTPLTRKRQKTPKSLPPSPSVREHARPK